MKTTLFFVAIIAAASASCEYTVQEQPSNVSMVIRSTIDTIYNNTRNNFALWDIQSHRTFIYFKQMTFRDQESVNSHLPNSCEYAFDVRFQWFGIKQVLNLTMNFLADRKFTSPYCIDPNEINTFVYKINRERKEKTIMITNEDFSGFLMTGPRSMYCENFYYVY